MTIVAERNLIGTGGAEGSVMKGVGRQVIQSVGATRTLLAKESGALSLMDSATGVIYTLPAPVAGMEFEFMDSITITSNVYKVITNAATVFLVGGIFIVSLTVAEAGDFFVANGTTHRAISYDGATKGGLVGGSIKFTAISATQWAVRGYLVGAGTLADPFATS